MKKQGAVVYGIHGVMERNIVIPAGQGRIVVAFKHGSYSGYGVSPAEYISDSPFVQGIIEQSERFKDGEIFIVHDYREERESTPDTDEAQTETEAKTKQELTPIDMPSIDDAKQYLIEHFSVTPSAVKTKAKVVAIAEANGIVFVGPDFD